MSDIWHMKRLLIPLAICLLFAGASFAKDDAIKPSMVSVSELNTHYSDVLVTTIQAVNVTVETVTLELFGLLPYQSILDGVRPDVIRPPVLKGNILAINRTKAPSHPKLAIYQPKGFRC